MPGKLESLRKMLSEGRVGFAADEVMSGTHQFLAGAGPEGEFPLEFRVTWGARHLGRWLNPFGGEFMTNFLHGRITAGGLVEDVACQGALELRYFTTASIRYRFEFTDNEGTRYRYLGEKVNIRPWNLHRSHTTCYGTITNLDTGQDISRSIVYFRLSRLPGFLASFRLA